MLTDSEQKEYQRMKTILNSCIQPDTGMPIPFVMRMSAFIPSNLPIIAGMQLTAPTPINSLFWQWCNQTYNAGFNISKSQLRKQDASVAQSNKEIITNYSIAVISAMSMILGFRKLSAPMIARYEGSLKGILIG